MALTNTKTLVADVGKTIARILKSLEKGDPDAGVFLFKLLHLFVAAIVLVLFIVTFLIRLLQ